MTFQLLPSEFPIYEENFSFFVISVLYCTVLNNNFQITGEE
jgi:hypothetical protein